LVTAGEDMSFSEFLDQAWNDHADNSNAVAKRFPEGIRLLEKNDQIPQLAGLMTHVMGEHLGEWEKGIELLKQLRTVSFFDSKSESEQAVLRSVASLEVAGNKRESLDDLSASNQILFLL